MKPNKKQDSTAKKGKHLTYAKRCKIETLLDEGESMRYIAEKVGCSPSTISREIKKHTLIKKSFSNDCLNRSNCQKKHACGSVSCKGRCRKCSKCKKYCDEYIQALCDMLEERGLCNGCHQLNVCHFEKKLYKATIADKEYRETLVERRNGFDLTYEQIELINNQVSPLIKKGQSPYHIKQALGNELSISESTLRRMISGNELDVRQIDLKEAVRRKVRNKKNLMKQEYTSPAKAGRMYEDFLQYIDINEVSVVEMDCIEGKKEDECAILSLHFVAFHMQLYYIMPTHTAESVVETLNIIEDSIGTEMFSELFEVILTDNGHEFWDIHGMESSLNTGNRTKIFFCEPNRSDQKGACENNHKIFRCIIPKGTSIDQLQQRDMVLITNHVNSYCRKSLFGSCPYDHAMQYINEDFFIFLGLEKIPAREVELTPQLLKKLHTPD
ncbi:MAG: IS30 family transposase [Lachnospiraceae bacterium]|nr:IS30 family transposase [Lachnospiraceae bacterium]